MKVVGRYQKIGSSATVTISNLEIDGEEGYSIRYSYTEDEHSNCQAHRRVWYTGTSSVDDPLRFHFTTRESHMAGPFSARRQSRPCDETVVAEIGKVEGEVRMTLPEEIDVDDPFQRGMVIGIPGGVFVMQESYVV